MEVKLHKRKGSGKLRTNRTITKWLKSLSSQVVITFLFNIMLAFLFLWNPGLVGVSANPDAKRLYDDLLSNYNRLIRPVINHTEKVTVKLGVSLSQIVELVSKICFFYKFRLLSFYLRVLSQKGGKRGPSPFSEIQSFSFRADFLRKSL